MGRLPIRKYNSFSATDLAKMAEYQPHVVRNPLNSFVGNNYFKEYSNLLKQKAEEKKQQEGK